MRLEMDPAMKLEAGLESARRRWIARDALIALSRLALAVIPPCLVLGWLDRRLDFSPLFRALELAGLIAWAVRSFRRHLRPVLARKRDGLAAALLLESHFRNFHGRLASRIEWMRGGRLELGSGGSMELARALCDRVDREALPLRLEEAVSLRPLRRPLSIAAAVLLAACLVAAFYPGLSGIWIRRTLLPLSDAPWPRRTWITGIADRYVVLKGDLLEVPGKAAGEVPRSGILEWRVEGKGGGAQDGSRRFEIAPDGSFAARVGPLLEPITVSLKAGDAKIGDVPVEVVVPPEIEAIEAVSVFPEFTGREPEALSSGDVRAIVGTRIDLTIKADRPVSRMDLAFGSPGSERAVPMALESGILGRASFQVRSKDRYQVRLIDPRGFSSRTPTTFLIDPLENGLPSVVLKRPSPERAVTPATRLRLEFEATDDFGIVSAAIRFGKRKGAGKDVEAAMSSVPIPLASRAKILKGEYFWDLGGIRLDVGDEVVYRLEVRDQGEHLSAETAGLSPERILRVVDPDSLRRSLERQAAEALSDLDRLMADLSAGRDALAAAVLDLPAGDEPLLPKDLSRVDFEESRQSRLGRELKRLGSKLAETSEELSESFLADPARRQALQDLAEALEKLREGPLAKSLEELRCARAALGQQ